MGVKKPAGTAASICRTLTNQCWVCCQVQNYLWLLYTAVHRQRAFWLAFLAGFSAACITKTQSLLIIAPMLHCVHSCHTATTLPLHHPPQAPYPHFAIVFDMHGLVCRWQQTRWSLRRTSSGRASCATTGSTMKLLLQESLPRSVHYPPSPLAPVTVPLVCFECHLASLLCCSS